MIKQAQKWETFSTSAFHPSTKNTHFSGSRQIQKRLPDEKGNDEVTLQFLTLLFIVLDISGSNESRHQEKITQQSLERAQEEVNIFSLLLVHC